MTETKQRLTKRYHGEYARVRDIGEEAASLLSAQTEDEVVNAIKRLAIYMAEAGGVISVRNAQLVRAFLIAAWRSPLISDEARTAIERHAHRVPGLCDWAVNREIERTEEMMAKYRPDLFGE